MVVIIEPDNSLPQGPAPAEPPPAASPSAHHAMGGGPAADFPGSDASLAAAQAGASTPALEPAAEGPPSAEGLVRAAPLLASSPKPGAALPPAEPAPALPPSGTSDLAALPGSPQRPAEAAGAPPVGQEEGGAAEGSQPGTGSGGSPEGHAALVPGEASQPPAEAEGHSAEVVEATPQPEIGMESPLVKAEEAAAEADEKADEEETEETVPFAPPLELIDETAEEELKFDWYILKVQVNREDAIKEALLRRVKREGMERYFKEIIVPTEDVVEFTKTGKRRIVKRKLYPGYLLVNMAVTDESWFLVRETPGIGDFTGSGGKPTPMDPRDVERILRSSKLLPEEEGGGVKTAIPFKPGDRVRVKEGYFQNFEGDVHAIDQTHGRVTVMINIFGRATPVEIEHWQIEAV